MSIELLEGAPGNGKSFSAVCRIVEALDRGQFVATNIELTDGWASAAARANAFRWLLPGRIRRVAARHEQRCFVSGDLEELFRVRLPGRGEGRGLMLLDECHVWLNARAWKEGDRQRIVRFFSAHRHLGWDVVLIAQDAEMIDKQVRCLAEIRTTLRNLRRWRPWGVPVCPFNVFIAISRWEGGNREVMRRRYYRLRRTIARLYNTLALADAADLLPEDAIRPPFNRPAAIASSEAPGAPPDGLWALAAADWPVEAGGA